MKILTTKQIQFTFATAKAMEYNRNLSARLAWADTFKSKQIKGVLVFFNSKLFLFLIKYVISIQVSTDLKTVSFF